MYPNVTYQVAYHPVGHLMSTRRSSSRPLCCKKPNLSNCGFAIAFACAFVVAFACAYCLSDFAFAFAFAFAFTCAFAFDFTFASPLPLPSCLGLYLCLFPF
jgi:hypothetical protein